MRLVAGRLQPKAAFHGSNPGEPIPKPAIGIHGIHDAIVAGAPVFADVWPELSSYIGGAVVIGHALGFDLAVLKRECERAGIDLVRLRTLDTPLPKRQSLISPATRSTTWPPGSVSKSPIAIPRLATNFGPRTDFLALLPKLREGGYPERWQKPSAPGRALTDVLDHQHRAGWVEAVEAPCRADTERTLRRIDSYPYRHRIRDIMRSPVQFIAADQLIPEALARMTNERNSPLYVRSLLADASGSLARDAGIITERDLLRALAQQDADALNLPVEQFMSKPLATVPADAFVYRAIARMSRLKIVISAQSTMTAPSSAP